MIKVEHENGYIGVLYGRSSLSIYKEGEEDIVEKVEG